MAGWMRYQIFGPILLLQFLNLFWYFSILRIAKRLVVLGPKQTLSHYMFLSCSAIFVGEVEDERSDDEGDDDDTPDDTKED